MRIGGFVIHGNNRSTIGACLDSLLAVSDEVIAIDSSSTDGSAEIVKSKGVRSLDIPWQGYGIARAAAVRELEGCDYVFFLDSDERLAPGAVEIFQEWRRSNPTLPYYRLALRDWADLPTGSFVLRTEWKTRIMRRDIANWQPEMIVHETLPDRECAPITAVIDHQFVTSIQTLVDKQDWYARLWAVQAHAEGKRADPTFLKRVGHVIRNCVVKGGLARGGLASVRLAWAVSRYHARKHQYLRLVQNGGLPEMVTAYREKRFLDLYALRNTPAGGAKPAPGQEPRPTA
ncbi:glycosyltransferase family 2 protein [Vulgatibacter incomptus]|uniref:Glycosyl transferase, group 2 family protein n=1 Tax=Vulgatibacter incomptus TaxID=1391653 RepID=A0A0K1P8I4_9BACT|nr:glycosyltransferase family 2 protein [Vulgatibacter incomptus]AKU89716.1 Glycosyl transferase, group 2 family protein [Vulgatibacter incomptus]